MGASALCGCQCAVVCGNALRVLAHAAGIPVWGLTVPPATIARSSREIKHVAGGSNGPIILVVNIDTPLEIGLMKTGKRKSMPVERR